MDPEDIGFYDRVIVAFSGGKDSLACVLRILEEATPETKKKIELWHHSVDGDPRPGRGDGHLMDWPVTEGYCRAVARELGLPIYFSWKEGGFRREMLRDGEPTAPISFESPGAVGVRTVGGKGPPGTRRKFPQVSADLSVRWCSAYLKIDVAARVFANDPRFSEGNFLLVTGERRQESAARAKYAELEKHKASNRRRRIDQWRAVIDYSEEDVWQVISRRGIRPHPAYDLGFGRVSCAACIFGDADQWAAVRAILPEQFEAVAAYEEGFGKTIQRRESVRELAARGEAGFLHPTLVKIARSREYADEQVKTHHWKLPSGAYKKCGGPT